MAVFAEAGIQFSVITPDRTAEVCTIVAENFFTDEPVFRSCGIVQNGITDSFIGDVIKGGSCVMATDSYGKIIGVRLTEVIDRGSWFRWMFDKVLKNILPSVGRIGWLLGKPVLQKTCEVFYALACELNYDVWPMFGEFGCQKILYDVLVTTAKDARVKGLGTELVKQGESVGRELGCDYSVNMVTGLYSGKVFREKCNYTVREELFYDQFLDKDGNLYLNDTREHLSIFTCHKNIAE